MLCIDRQFILQRVAQALAQSFNISVATLLICLTVSVTTFGQDSRAVQAAGSEGERKTLTAALSVVTENWAAAYVDPVQGVSSIDLVRRALSSNAELAAVRLDINRARGRLRQAGLRPNPTIDIEQQRGVLNTPGESATSIGLAVPLEFGGKRKGRMDLAQAELEAVEAEVADRERRLVAEVRLSYAEAMAALRELEIMVQFNNLDSQTAKIIEARVTEGDAAPLELNLMRVEINRIQARRSLVEGRLVASLLRLKSITGMPTTDLLRLREDLATSVLPEPPDSLDAAIDIALRSRPDLRLAKLNEEVAQAGLKLAKSQAFPDITAFGRYSHSRSSFDQTPIGALMDRDKMFAVGVSIGIPVFNRNQGAKAEAGAAIAQSQQRRQFVEAVVRAEVSSAYARYLAATQSIKTFEDGVINRSNENIRSIRGAYQIGAFRLTELLTEQRRLIDLQREYTDALTERYRALADMQAALGLAINP